MARVAGTSNSKFGRICLLCIFSRDKNKSTAVWMEKHSDIIIYRDMSGLIVPFFTGTFVSIGAGLLQHPQLFQNSRLLAVSE